MLYGSCQQTENQGLWHVLKVFHSYVVEATVEFAELTTLIGDNRARKKIALIVPIKLFGADTSDWIIKARFINRRKFR